MLLYLYCIIDFVTADFDDCNIVFSLFNNKLKIELKLKMNYAEACGEFCRAHLRVIAPGQHSSF